MVAVGCRQSNQAMWVLHLAITCVSHTALLVHVSPMPEDGRIAKARARLS